MNHYHNSHFFFVIFSAFIFQAILCICDEIRLLDLTTRIHYGKLSNSWVMPLIQLVVGLVSFLLLTWCMLYVKITSSVDALQAKPQV